MTANGVATSTVTVTLKDAQSHPVSGKTVTLAKGSGSSTITTVSGVTNGSGVATFTVKDTVAEATTYTATDTTDTVTVTQTATVTFTAGPVSGRPVDRLGVACIRARRQQHDLDDHRDVEGRAVQPRFRQDGHAGKSGGSSTITTVSGVTNGSGVATFTVKDAAVESTTYTATDTTDTVTVTQTAAVTFTAGPVTAAQSTVSAAPASVVADGSTTSTVTVTLKDAQSHLIAGKTVTLAKGGWLVDDHDRLGCHQRLRCGDVHGQGHGRRGDDLHGDRHDGRGHRDADGVGDVHGRAGHGRAVDGQRRARLGHRRRLHDLDRHRHPEGRPVEPGLRQDGDARQGRRLLDDHDRLGHDEWLRAGTFTVKDTVAEATTYTATDTTDAVTVTQTATVTFTAGAVTAAQSTVSRRARVGDRERGHDIDGDRHA